MGEFRYRCAKIPVEVFEVLVSDVISTHEWGPLAEAIGKGWAGNPAPEPMELTVKALWQDGDVMRVYVEHPSFYAMTCCWAAKSPALPVPHLDVLRSAAATSRDVPSDGA